jgi:hypothetical protein
MAIEGIGALGGKVPTAESIMNARSVLAPPIQGQQPVGNGLAATAVGNVPANVVQQPNVQQGNEGLAAMALRNPGINNIMNGARLI